MFQFFPLSLPIISPSCFPVRNHPFRPPAQPRSCEAPFLPLLEEGRCVSLLPRPDLEKLLRKRPSNDGAVEELMDVPKAALGRDGVESPQLYVEIVGDIYIYIHRYTYIHTYVRTYIHTYHIHIIPYHTTPYHTIPLHYITLHYIHTCAKNTYIHIYIYIIDNSWIFGFGRAWLVYHPTLSPQPLFPGDMIWE